MKQTSLASHGFKKYAKTTRRAVFLNEMERIVPWTDICKLIEPHYPKAGNGRPPIGVERMFRIYCLQQWFNLSDPAAEESLYDSECMREFVGIDLGVESAPDETTICNFRHLLERNELGRKLFEEVGRYLLYKGVKVSSGTIVDATIISAPSSTKNEDNSRDPEMKPTKKGNQWHFGMKGHIGVDSKTKLIHSAQVTPANVHDSQVLPGLLHGTETRVYGDSAYTGQKEAIKRVAPKAKDFTNRRGARAHELTESERRKNQRKSSIRAKVEHAFGVIKGVFKFTKVRYRGIAKNANRFFAACALANLFMVRKRLMLHPGG
jgi:transposase, IS5 family